MAHAVDISLEEALILQAFEDNILSEEEAFLSLELLACNENEPIMHRNYERPEIDSMKPSIWKDFDSPNEIAIHLH